MPSQIDLQIPLALGLLSVSSFLGCLGNGIVIIIFSFLRSENCTTSLFIYVLAIVDFSTCVCVIPFTMVYEFFNWNIGSQVLCFIYYVLNTFNVPFSSLLTSCIAIDRYFSICHPFQQFFNVQRAKILIIVLGIFSLSLAVSTTQLAFLSIGEQVNISTFNKTYYKCTDPSQLSLNLKNSINLKLFNIFQKINHSCYVICIIVVLFLYILIYRSIILLRYRKRRLQGRRDTKSHEIMSSFIALRRNEVHLPNDIPNPPLIANNHLAIQQLNSSSFILSPRSSCCSRTSNIIENKVFLQKTSKSFSKDSDLLHNIRSAIMLFVVAVVYITSFIPALLMANKIVELNLAVFYLYYFNNAANPIIYCFMNQQFRSDLKRIFRIS